MKMLTDGRQTDDGRTTDAGVTGILIAHLGASGSGELKRDPLTDPRMACPYLSPKKCLRRVVLAGK